jgi:hypothetical protein
MTTFVNHTPLNIIVIGKITIFEPSSSLEYSAKLYQISLFFCVTSQKYFFSQSKVVILKANPQPREASIVIMSATDRVGPMHRVRFPSSATSRGDKVEES